MLLMLGFFALAHRVAHAEATPAQDDRLKEIIAGDHRSVENKARDKYRNPLETLTFFGIRPDMTVVEIYPGRGWYTEILAPYLKGSGTLYAAEHPGDPSYEAVQKSLEAFDQTVKGRARALRRSKTDKADQGRRDRTARLGRPARDLRNLHNWMMFGWQREAFAAMHAALKPGGVLGVVEHRGDPQRPQDPKAASGYVQEQYAIELIESAGFKLLGRPPRSTPIPGTRRTTRLIPACNSAP